MTSETIYQEFLINLSFLSSDDKKEISDLYKIHKASVKYINKILIRNGIVKPPILTQEIVYRIDNCDYAKKYCLVCGEECTEFYHKLNRFKECCSIKCSKNYAPNILKCKESLFKNYGVYNTCDIRDSDGRRKYEVTAEKIYGTPYCVTIVGENGITKCKNTMSEKYGADNPSKLDWVKDKKIETCLHNHQVEHPMQSEEVRCRSTDSIFLKYGVYNASNIIGDNGIRVTTQGMIDKYGIGYSSQVPDIHDKIMSHRRTNKKYTFPSGKTYNVQGYEPKALDFLLSNGVIEDDIILINRPSIKYFWSSSDGFGDDKWHVYHPDMLIKSLNKIIEVKSTWTYDGKGKRPDVLSKNIAKKEGSIFAGYLFEFMIME